MMKVLKLETKDINKHIKVYKKGESGIELITIDNTKCLIEIEYEDNSQWETMIIPFSTLLSIKYKS